MTKLLLTLALIFLALPEVKAQTQDNTLLIEEYLRQSEKQKKVGITLLVAGGAAFCVGSLIAWNSASWDGFGNGAFLGTVGGVAVLVGIPIIVSSASKARKAATLSVGANSARQINPTGSSLKIYPALNLSIPLHFTNR